ncbi:MAG: hypothetical protein EOO65_03880 [Methanosarcinales archaeon]|nr:MAG: hypothetical protein EOO65_03880 [Methanosarcinales archaeon]
MQILTRTHPTTNPPVDMAVSRACTKQLTLVLLHATDRVLLGMKKRGFGMNKVGARVCAPFAESCVSAHPVKHNTPWRLRDAQLTMMRAVQRLRWENRTW